MSRFLGCLLAMAMLAAACQKKIDTPAPTNPNNPVCRVAIVGDSSGRTVYQRIVFDDQRRPVLVSYYKPVYVGRDRYVTDSISSSLSYSGSTVFVRTVYLDRSVDTLQAVIEDGFVRSVVRNYVQNWYVDSVSKLPYLSQDSMEITYDNTGVPLKMAVHQHHSRAGRDTVDHAAYNVLFLVNFGTVHEIDYAYLQRFPQDTGKNRTHTTQINLSYDRTSPIVPITPLPGLDLNLPTRLNPVPGYSFYLGNRLPIAYARQYTDTLLINQTDTYQQSYQLDHLGFPLEISTLYSYTNSFLTPTVKVYYQYDCD